MGNYRRKISSIMPTSWFYKFKNFSSSKQNMPRKQPSTTSSPAFDQRKSYYFTRDLTLDIHNQDSQPPNPSSPRNSAKKRRPKKSVHRNLVTGAGRCSCGVKPESESNSSDTCSCKTNSSYDDVHGKTDLRPVITKPAKSESGQCVKEGIIGISNTHTRSPVKKVKGDCYSPRIGNRVRVQGINGGRRSGGNRRSLSESMVVVKTSLDPGKDFRESMVEMIMQNKMTSSNDLEDLLACYLSLNSNEYHDLIIRVFKQIWFESTNIRL